MSLKRGQDFVVGRSKVFIREAAVVRWPAVIAWPESVFAMVQVFNLEDMVDRKFNDAVVVIQKSWRKYTKKRCLHCLAPWRAAGATLATGTSSR